MMNQYLFVCIIKKLLRKQINEKNNRQMCW